MVRMGPLTAGENRYMGTKKAAGSIASQADGRIDASRSAAQPALPVQPDRIERGFQAMRARLGTPPPQDPLLAERVRQGLIDQGVVVSASELSEGWGRTLQALDHARAEVRSRG